MYDGKHERMGWCMTPDLDRFLAAAGGYLRSRAAENSLLLAATQDAQDAQHAQHAQDAPGPADVLYGWWEPPDGSGPRGAFMHDQSSPLLIACRAPETAAALAGELARTGRWVCGVDAATGAADAFAAAWSQRSGVTVRVYRLNRVYRLAGAAPYQTGPAGRYRVATRADRALLVDWLAAFGAEVGELSGSPETDADELLDYGGAAFWEVGGRPTALATVTRPVARTVRLATVFTPPQHRHNGYATAVMLAVSRATLAGQVSEMVLITDRNSPERQAARLGYELIGERAVLRFSPPTAPIPRVKTGPMSRAQTGPMPRLRG